VLDIWQPKYRREKSRRFCPTLLSLAAFTSCRDGPESTNARAG